MAFKLGLKALLGDTILFYIEIPKLLLLLLLNFSLLFHLFNVYLIKILKTFSSKFLLGEILLILRARSLFRKDEDENFSWR